MLRRAAGGAVQDGNARCGHPGRGDDGPGLRRRHTPLGRRPAARAACGRPVRRIPQSPCAATSLLHLCGAVLPRPGYYSTFSGICRYPILSPVCYHAFALCPTVVGPRFTRGFRAKTAAHSYKTTSELDPTCADESSGRTHPRLQQAYRRRRGSRQRARRRRPAKVVGSGTTEVMKPKSSIAVWYVPLVRLTTTLSM